MEEQEPERYYEWMLWKLRKEKEKCELKDVLMNPLEASRRIVALEKRLDLLIEELRAERDNVDDN